METKPFYQSKTLWLNGISFILIVLPLISAYVLGGDIVGEKTAGTIAGLIGLLTTILNALLRFLTTQPISGGATPPGPEA